MLKEKYRPDVDGLRAIAILAVVAFHAFPTLVPGGFVGVDVFFVISGFLISGMLLNDLDANRFDLLNFYGRRVRRIFPALIAVLFACLIAGWIYLLPVDLTDLSWQALWSSLFASNIYFWQHAGYFDTSAATQMLLHLWSLGVEEQFYILWPAMLYVMHRHGANALRPISAVFIVSLAINLACVHRWPVATFYLPFSRLWELAMGGILAYVMRNVGDSGGIASRLWRELVACMGLGLIIFSALLFTSDKLYPGLRALCPTLGAALIICAAERTAVNRLLSTRLFVLTGLISYPLYLWHWPLLAFLRMHSVGAVDQITIIEAIVASVVLASLTYTFVEAPIRFGRCNKRLITQSLIGAMCGSMVIASTGIVTRGFPQRLPPMLRILDNRFDSAWVAAHWHEPCFHFPEDHFKDECIDSEPKDAPLVVLWGDSHAASLYPGFRALQRTQHFRLAESTTISCPPILDYDEPVRPGSGRDMRTECVDGNKDMVRRIASLRPAAVVILAGWWRYSLSPRWGSYVLNELKVTLKTLKSTGVKQIILLGPLPTWQPHFLSKLMGDAWQQRPSAPLPDRIAYGLAPTLPEVNAALRQAAMEEGITYLAPMDYFCNSDGCITKFGDGPDDMTTWDDAHLTPVAASYLVNAIMPRLLNQ